MRRAVGRVGRYIRSVPRTRPASQGRFELPVRPVTSPTAACTTSSSCINAIARFFLTPRSGKPLAHRSCFVTGPMRVIPTVGFIPRLPMCLPRTVRTWKPCKQAFSPIPSKAWCFRRRSRGYVISIGPLITLSTGRRPAATNSGASVVSVTKVRRTAARSCRMSMPIEVDVPASNTPQQGRQGAQKIRQAFRQRLRASTAHRSPRLSSRTQRGHLRDPSALPWTRPRCAAPLCLAPRLRTGRGPDALPCCPSPRWRLFSL